GAKEIVFTGIDLASYKDGRYGLAQLVEAVLEEADRACPPDELPARVRASSIEPHTLDEALVDLLSSSKGRLCRHLHLPMQSGSTKVLREMARPYSAQRFRELVEHLYERVPELALTTDIIAGFPGETDEEFEQTLELARLCRFSKIHAFPYSKRAGTPAAQRGDQVAPEVKAERAARLRALGDTLRKEDFARRCGTEELVIVEDDCALTESYHEIAIPPGAVPGELVRTVLEFPL
ncbi:MAG: radical SAM protein, partial [Eggerthellaceae bacterium]|nr:radical SAM protein [Eggerthellaceae bacterium]